MARKTSTDLFELVQSMNPSEKRYFKVFTSLHTMGEGNKYMQLFEIIEGQDAYDENFILEKLNTKQGASFSKMKKYLYELILKAMRNYNNEKNGSHLINNAIDDTAILFDKGLHKQALKSLEKAEKIAEQYELISYQFLIKNWWQRLSFHLGNEQKSYGEEELQNLEAYQTLNKYMEGFALIQEFARNYSALTDQEQLPEKVIECLHAKETGTLGVKAQFFYHRIRAVYFRLARNYPAYLKETEKTYKLCQEHAGFENEDELTYQLEPILEFCNALLNNHQFADFKKYIKKATPHLLTSEEHLNKESQANINAYITLMKSEYARLNGQLGQAEAFEKEIAADIALQDGKPSKAVLDLHYWELINWQVAKKDYHAAIDYLKELEAYRSEFQTKQAARVLRWVALFELKEFKTLRKEIKNEELTTEIEKTVGDFLMLQSEEDSISRWISLRKKLKTLQEIESEKIHFKYFNLVDWINEHLLHDSNTSRAPKQMIYF